VYNILTYPRNNLIYSTSSSIQYISNIILSIICDIVSSSSVNTHRTTLYILGIISYIVPPAQFNIYQTSCYKSCVIQSLPLDSIRIIHPKICQFGIPRNNLIYSTSSSIQYISNIILSIICDTIATSRFNTHYTSWNISIWYTLE